MDFKSIASACSATPASSYLLDKLSSCFLYKFLRLFAILQSSLTLVALNTGCARSYAVKFSGGDGEIRTHELRFCRPLP